MAAFFITGMMMLAAVSVDYGRMQAFRAQLRTAADAAAHSGAVIMSETESIVGVKDSAKSMGDRELVNGESPNIQIADIQIGDWDDDAHTLDTIPPIAGYDAVKVTARYNGTFLMARFFGVPGGQLKVTSIAWTRGSVVNTECLKPWAVPYAALLGAIGHDPTDWTHDLSDPEIDQLTATPVPLKISLGGSTAGNIYWEEGQYAGQDVHMYTPGNFGHLDLAPNVTYRDEILSCVENDVDVGDMVLDSQTGVSSGQTTQGVEALCRENGSYVATPAWENNPNDFGCEVPLKVAIYGYATAQGTNTSYSVKYIGGIVLTGYAHPGWLKGYFTGFQTTGNVSSAPGPVSRIILVY